jgi:hypothetical protein
MRNSFETEGTVTRGIALFIILFLHHLTYSRPRMPSLVPSVLLVFASVKVCVFFWGEGGGHGK